MTIHIRDAGAQDAPALAAIYRPYVLTGLATFEEVPPTAGEMADRRLKVVAAGLPYLAAEAAGETIGYAYAGPFHSRAAYRSTIEDSIYVAEDWRGRGAGRVLLEALIARCEAGPWRQMVAAIGDSANAGSIALHRKAGFQLVGTLRRVGFKLGQWVDTVLMQRELGGR